MFKFFQFQKKNIWLNVYNEKIRNFIGCPFCLFHLHPLYFSFFFHSFLFQFIIDWFEISNIFHYYIHKTSFKNHYITSDIDYIRRLKVYFFFILMNGCNNIMCVCMDSQTEQWCDGLIYILPQIQIIHINIEKETKETKEIKHQLIWFEDKFIIQSWKKTKQNNWIELLLLAESNWWEMDAIRNEMNRKKACMLIISFNIFLWTKIYFHWWIVCCCFVRFFFGFGIDDDWLIDWLT